MKLLKRTYIATLKWLLPVVILSSFYCYFMIVYIEKEETDEFLTYEMNRLLDYHNLNHDLPEYHRVTDIIPDLKYDAPVFKDTFLLEPADNEMVPHRELRFSIHHNGKDFTIVLRQLMLGQDDMIEGTLFIVVGIVGLFILFVLIVVSNINRKIWKPFYSALNQLVGYKINEPAPKFETSEITEFETLNETLAGLLEKTSADYGRSKEYNENVSHELQTHLAVIRANTEKLMNEWKGEKEGVDVIRKIYSAATELSRIQKSLSLLNKIGNQEFDNKEPVDFKTVIIDVSENFAEVIELKGLDISLKTENSVHEIDRGLADVLVNNLIKNAIKHNVEGGYISVILTKKNLEVTNSGQSFEGDTNRLLDRFTKGETGNTGIGLSIVHQICLLSNYKLHYSIENSNIHKIKISFG